MISECQDKHSQLPLSWPKSQGGLWFPRLPEERFPCFCWQKVGFGSGFQRSAHEMPPKDNWLVINKVQLALCMLGSWLLSFQCGGLRTVPLGFIRSDGALFRGLKKGSTSKASADPPTDVGEGTQSSRAGKQMLHSNSRSRHGKRSPRPPMQGGAESRRDPVLSRATPGRQASKLPSHTAPSSASLGSPHACGRKFKLTSRVPGPFVL